MKHALARQRPRLQALGGLRRLLPVAAHHVAAADHELAGRAVGQTPARLVGEPVLLVRHAAAHRQRPEVELLGREVRHALAFGLAVHREERGLRERGAQLADLLLGERCGGVGDDAKRREVVARQRGEIREQVERRRHAGQHRDLRLRRDLEDALRKRKAALEHHCRADLAAHQHLVQAIAERERQRAEDDVVLAVGEIGHHRIGRAHHVEMREHHALRLAGGARCIDDRRQVLVDRIVPADGRAVGLALVGDDAGVHALRLGERTIAHRAQR